ncbi:hypothetical protein AK88_04313 [Plasmodium fragile]|uniref:Plasmodium RESA N-terminal domain-containing protein n=1 Tax=Plasmodium fragile TaxID=5857 RepID=A0A0D9QJY9_PLAFR|nr:uncharacterized protein AK88_04313 [Plasmodium fragile]KJP86056.1 hypothetical protein AK88_04313 [Plasmodium fragile]
MNIIMLVLNVVALVLVFRQSLYSFDLKRPSSYPSDGHKQTQKRLERILEAAQWDPLHEYEEEYGPDPDEAYDYINLFSLFQRHHEQEEEQANENQPNANQPSANQPNANQPSANQPNANQPNANQPNAQQPNEEQNEEQNEAEFAQFVNRVTRLWNQTLQHMVNEYVGYTDRYYMDIDWRDQMWNEHWFTYLESAHSDLNRFINDHTLSVEARECIVEDLMHWVYSDYYRWFLNLVKEEWDHEYVRRTNSLITQV